MKREILLSGLLGGVVMFAWLIVTHGPLPLSGDSPRPIPNDKEIHTILKERLSDSGIYYTPDSSDESRVLYPNFGTEPLFIVTATGRTPDSFLGQLLLELFCIFSAPLIAAWLLSVTSVRILGRFFLRLVFVAVLGALVAVCSGMSSDAPIEIIALSSLNSLIMWGLAGLVIAWRIKPVRQSCI